MKYVLTFLISGLLLSCNKGNNIQYSFSGIITDSVQLTPLNDVEVDIFQIPFNSSVTSNTFQLVAHGTSAQNGLYHLVFDREKATQFKLEMTKMNYFEYLNEFNADDISSEKENIYNGKLEPKSWVTFEVKNLLPADQADEFTLVLYNYRDGCDGCATDDYNYLNGIVDTTMTYTSTAGQYFNFMLINVTTGQTSLDSVYMTPFDTTVYSVNY